MARDVGVVFDCHKFFRFSSYANGLKGHYATLAEGCVILALWEGGEKRPRSFLIFLIVSITLV